MARGRCNMSSTGRRISAQGDLDGACFLYSIVNAYAALTGGAPSFGNLCAAMAQVPHPGDFLNPSVGTTGRYDLDYPLLQSTMERMLAALAGEDPQAQQPGSDSPGSQQPGAQESGAQSLSTTRFRVRRIEGPNSIPALAALLDARSVVILRYQGSSHFADDMDHWVCAVAGDAAGDRLDVACSVRHQRACNGSPCGYAETFHPEFGRWSNDQLCPERAHTLVEGEVFCVRLEGKSLLGRMQDNKVQTDNYLLCL